MITVDGVQHPTVQEAAAAFGVSTRAVRDYIRKGIIPPPPTVAYGVRDVDVFPSEYMEKAREHINAYRARRREERTRRMRQ